MIYNNNIVPDIFHIGYQRTGSTWLQKGLFPLVDDKIYFAKTRQWEIYSANIQEDLSGIYNQINHEHIKGRIIIESEEALSGGRFRDYLENAKKLSWINPNARILICIRSQYTMFPSLYSLYVRKGGAMSYENYVRILLENKKLDYWTLINAYYDNFSSNNIKIMLFEDLASNPELYVSSLFNWLKINARINMPGEKYYNKRPVWGYLNLLKLMNLILGITNLTQRQSDYISMKLKTKLRMRQKIVWPMSVLLHKLNISKELVLSEDLKKEITNLYSPGNNKLFNFMQRPIKNSGYPGQ